MAFLRWLTKPIEKAVKSVIRHPKKILPAVAGGVLLGPAATSLLGSSSLASSAAFKLGGLVSGGSVGGTFFTGMKLLGLAGTGLGAIAGKAAADLFSKKKALSSIPTDIITEMPSLINNPEVLKEKAIEETREAFFNEGVYNQYDYPSRIKRIMRRRKTPSYKKYLFSPFDAILKSHSIMIPKLQVNE